MSSRTIYSLYAGGRGWPLLQRRTPATISHAHDPDAMHIMCGTPQSSVGVAGALRTESRHPDRRACRRAPAIAGWRAAGRVAPKSLLSPLIAAPAAATRAIQHGQRRVEALQHDFGRILFHALGVGVLARLQLAFEINLRALLQILLGDLGEPFAEDHDPVPLGALLAARPSPCRASFPRSRRSCSRPDCRPACAALPGPCPGSRPE